MTRAPYVFSDWKYGGNNYALAPGNQYPHMNFFDVNEWEHKVSSFYITANGDPWP